jgi:hypothetical protein
MSAEAGQEVIRLLYTGDSSHSEGSEEGQREENGLRSERQDERLAVFDAAVAEIAARVLPVYDAAEGWRERTRTGLIALLVALDERPAPARALVIDSIAWGPAVLERRGELLEALAGALEDARAEVDCLPAPPQTTGENLVGASLAWIHKRLLQESGPLAELAPSLASMIVHPYLGDEAAQEELERPLTQLGVEVSEREGQGPVSRVRATPS